MCLWSKIHLGGGLPTNPQKSRHAAPHDIGLITTETLSSLSSKNHPSSVFIKNILSHCVLQNMSFISLLYVEYCYKEIADETENISKGSRNIGSASNRFYNIFCRFKSTNTHDWSNDKP